MKKIFLISFFTCIIQISNAQHDNLEPVSGYFSSTKSDEFYYPLVKKALIDSLGSNPEARILVLPSFTNEYLVSIDTENGIPYLTYRIVKQQIWYNRKSKELLFEQFKIPFDAQMTSQINALFFLATSKVQYSTNSLMEDGTTYNFICFKVGIGIRSGKTKSPESSKMVGLVKITDWLANCAKKGEIIDRDKMTIFINDLIDKFKRT